MKALCLLVPVLAATLALLLACEKTPSEPAGTRPAESSAAPAQASSATPAAAAETPPPLAPEQPKAIPAPADVAAPPADARKTASGLALKVLTPGKAKEHPGPEDKVTVHYTGWTTDGKMFDSSVARGEPTSFRVSGVIKGWTEGLQLMTAGEKARLWIPGKLAYGDAPAQPGMPAGMLVFDVELIDFTAAPKPPTVPTDVKAPPAAAKKTESGLAYRVLQKGKGARHPAATDTVKVHYSGWTTDGKMFDSSVTRGEPATFALNRVIKGWTEGVQLMVEGEKTRFWIPADLAYGSSPRPGAPSGPLTFDIELLEIQ
jgi:FKBP-type peptidyl-prolyl cis-trans isomerase